MKKLLTFIFLLFSFFAFSQNNGINFQGVGRNASGAVLITQKISLRFSVIQGSETGTVEYVESKEVSTNAQGIFSVVIGDGSQISKTGNFLDINWKINPKFLKVEMDPAGGASFATMGTTRLQSVPFAYYANGVNADNVDGVLSASKGGTGVASISALKTTLGIDQINNTSDLAKPISTATQAALDTKVSTTTFSSTIETKASISDLDLKANISDVTLKAPLESPSFSGTVSGITKAMVGLSNVDNTTDLAKPISAAAQAALDTKVSTAIFTSTFSTKENIANKSSATDLGGNTPSDILYPTQKAVKEYIAANSASGSIADGGITTIKLADNSVTDGKLVTISGTKVIGDIAGKAATVTTNANLTGVVTSLGNVTSIANGSISNSMLANSAVTNLSGINTGDNAINSNYSSLISNATHTGDAIGSTELTVVKINGTSLAGLSTGILKNTTGTGVPSIAVAGDFPLLNQSTTGNAATASKLATARNINGVSFDGTGDITISATADAGTLTGTILKSSITGSNLTSVGTLTNLAVTNPINGNITGNAATVTTNANLTGVVTSIGNATSIANGSISNSMLANTAVSNLSGINTGDNAVNSNYSSLVSNATHTGDATGSTTLTVVRINGTSLAALATGILKNTTGTGVPSIAVAGDFPILNQSTSGNAATATKLATARNINGISFDGSADITISASANAENLSGTSLKSTVTGSSLTSLGILNNVTVNGKVVAGATSETSSSAILEANSTTQGFLPPRMTLAQRIAITNPAQGLIIYCTNCGSNGEPEYYNGTSWLNLAGNAAAKAIPTINITVGNYTYTAGTSQGPNYSTNTGTGSTYAYSYVGIGSTTYAASSTRPTNAGTYSVTVTLSASSDGNYNTASSSAAFTIAKAIPIVTPTIGTYTYSLATPVAQGPSTSTNTGTGSTYTYSYVGTGFTSYGPSSTKPIDGGTYNVIASVSASSDGNFAATSSTPTAFKIALNLSIGNSYGGGKVAYILQSGDIGYDPAQQHGLIISGDLTPNLTDIIWGTSGVYLGAIGGLDNLTPSGTSTFVELGAGINNTNLIIASEGAGTNYAAGLARAYRGGGYTNWYLPSYSELIGIRYNSYYLGPINRTFYWTSTEGDGDPYNAWLVGLAGSSGINEGDKSFANGGVRAVRVF